MHVPSRLSVDLEFVALFWDKEHRQASFAECKILWCFGRKKSRGPDAEMSCSSTFMPRRISHDDATNSMVVFFLACTEPETKQLGETQLAGDDMCRFFCFPSRQRFLHLHRALFLQVCTVFVLWGIPVPDGAAPYVGLTEATEGNLVGTTAVGGVNGDGTAFKITSSGALTTLHSFDHSDGHGLYLGLRPLLRATAGYRRELLRDSIPWRRQRQWYGLQNYARGRVDRITQFLPHG